MVTGMTGLSFNNRLFYFFVASLIVCNVEFVQPFSVQCNRHRFLSRAHIIGIRSPIMKIYTASKDNIMVMVEGVEVLSSS